MGVNRFYRGGYKKAVSIHLGLTLVVS